MKRPGRRLFDANPRTKTTPRKRFRYPLGLESLQERLAPATLNLPTSGIPTLAIQQGVPTTPTVRLANGDIWSYFSLNVECPPLPTISPTLPHGPAMAGLIITTDMTREEALKIARNTARDFDYELEKLDNWTFRATQGSLALSVFLGAFIAYCNFEVEIRRSRYEDEVDIIINRNSPWWTGLIGIGRVKNRARELADEIAYSLRDQGARRAKKREF